MSVVSETDTGPPTSPHGNGGREGAPALSAFGSEYEDGREPGFRSGFAETLENADASLAAKIEAKFVDEAENEKAARQVADNQEVEARANDERCKATKGMGGTGEKGTGKKGTGKKGTGKKGGTGGGQAQEVQKKTPGIVRQAKLKAAVVCLTKATLAALGTMGVNVDEKVFVGLIAQHVAGAAAGEEAAIKEWVDDAVDVGGDGAGQAAKRGLDADVEREVAIERELFLERGEPPAKKGKMGNGSGSVDR
ncbi:hypothetical protein LTR36_004562 [Oleoguttula mirabilis]|uniref:Uncharacterized protein n=1 Tax=Oleoguttula mirabilis TaxID=1507867 RepID=A0AAV9JGW4_9PEZI|nr:hypothetical protein LTR36_004562 [Oleoguttula mirabilis]